MVNPFNLILRFLTLKLQLLVLMILAYALVIKDSGYESTVQYFHVENTDKILIPKVCTWPPCAGNAAVTMGDGVFWSPL